MHLPRTQRHAPRKRSIQYSVRHIGEYWIVRFRGR